MENNQKQFIIGSKAFFDHYDDYESKDVDEIVILDRPLNISNKSIKVLNMKHDHKDVFFYWPLSKEEFIQEALNSDLPMKAGKFLVKEFAEYIGMTIEDLKRLKCMFDKIDENHCYEKIIYDSYIENNGFFMTNDQLNKAYKKYKECKK